MLCDWSTLIWNLSKDAPTCLWLFCLESTYLRRPRSLNFRDQCLELPSQSHPTTCTEHRLWYRPEEQRGLQDSLFFGSHEPINLDLILHANIWMHFAACSSAMTAVDRSWASSIQYSLKWRLSSCSPSVFVKAYMLRLRTRVNDPKSRFCFHWIQILFCWVCHCILIRFTICVSQEVLLHIAACRQRLSIHNHLH